MSAKSLDGKGRFRSKTISFRISPEENQQLDIKVKLSGLTKQNYLINRALQKDIIVQQNPRVYKALKSQLEEVLNELRKIDNGDNDELLETIRLITITLGGTKYGVQGDNPSAAKTFDMRYECQKYLCVTFAESNKGMGVPPI